MKRSEPVQEGTRLDVHVQPRSSRNDIAADPGGRVRVFLTAPPVEGEANSALIAFLSKKLDVPKRDIRLVKGEKSREKAVFVEGLSALQVAHRLGLPDNSVERP